MGSRQISGSGARGSPERDHCARSARAIGGIIGSERSCKVSVPPNNSDREYKFWKKGVDDKRCLPEANRVVISPPIIDPDAVCEKLDGGEAEAPWLAFRGVRLVNDLIGPGGDSPDRE